MGTGFKSIKSKERREKMKTEKKWCARVCAGILTVTTVLSPLNVTAQENEGQESTDWRYETSWEEVSALLDKHLGVYEEPSSFDPTTRHTPDGPLMGNGTVLAYLSGKTPGDAKDETIYISRLDNFEELNANSRDVQYVGYGGIDIKRIDSDESVEEFRMEQDMKLAQVKGISENGFQTDTWLSAKENIIVSEITNLTDQPMDLDISVWTNVTDKVNQGISSVDAGIDQENNLIYASRRTGCDLYDWSVNSTTALKLLNKEADMEKVDDHTSKFSVSLEADESIYMIAAVEGGKESETYYEDAVKKVLSYDSEFKINEAQTAHREWWKEYWLQSYLDLDEESDSIERLYYGQMYQIGCALQAVSENPAEGVTAGLFPWTGSSAPDWQGDYTLNSDVQRAIGVAVTANRLNHIDNYTQVIEDFWDTGVENASNPQHLNWLISGSDHKQFTEGIRGALFPTHIGPWGSRTEHFNAPNDYFCSPANGTMVLQPLIQYYKATLDEEYLVQTLYPMVREQANFWVDYAEKDTETGKYNIYGATYESWTAYKNATLDLASAEFMLKNAIAFSEHLGQDADLCVQWKEVHDNLAEYPTKNGYYIEDERGADPITFSCFNVYGFAFYDLVGPSSSQEEKDKILTWLETKQEFGTSDKQTRAAMTSARVGFDPDIWLDQMKAGYVDRTPDDWMGIRPNNTIGDVGASLFSGAIMESLMQSHEGFINFFPAWYDDQEASFKNQRAYGAFTVSGRQNAWGQVEDAAIHSEKGTECFVLNPWQEDGLEMKVYKDGEEVKTTVEENSLGNVYAFQTEAGEDYELKPAGELPEKLVLDRKSVTLQPGERIQLNASTSAGSAVTWSTDNSEVVTVEQDGTVLAIGTGKATVKAEASDTMFATCEVYVTSIIEAENFIQAGNVTIENGGTTVGYIDTGDWLEYKVFVDKPGKYDITYKVAVNSGIGEVEFVVNDTVLAATQLPSTGGWNNWTTVRDSVRFPEAGEYTVRLNVVQGGWNFDFFELTLNDKNEGIELVDNNITVYMGIPKKIAVYNYTDKKLIWSSSDENVASVDSEGVITPSKPGVTTITVSAEGTEYTDTCKVTVQKNEHNYMMDHSIFTSSGYHDNFVPENVADGKTGGTSSESAAYAWVSPNVPITEPRWVAVEFAEPVTINKWRVTHIDKDGDGGSVTKDFELQISEDGESWTTVDTVTDNTELVSDRSFADNGKVTSRFFRLYITEADNYNGQWPNNMSRIDEWELVYEYGGYTVEFLPGEGTGEMERQEFIYNEEKPLNSNDFTKEGYLFTGWMDEEGNLYEDGQVISNLTPEDGATVVLTAQWKPIQYQISYDLNEGEGTVPERVTCTYDTEVTLASEDGITRAGYIMAGWNTEKDGSGTDYAAGSTVSNLTVKDGENIILYAKWEKESAVGKKTLEYFLNKAKGYVEDGSVDSCVESVQKLFAEAIAEGDAVMADANATREEVTNATVKLMRAIHALDMKAGDKTDLEMAVELGDSIDLTKYVEAGQAEFTDALAKAKEVLSDGDAFQEDIDSAWNALVDAISNLRLKADKSVLEDLINEAEGIDTSLYTEESAGVFTAAFQKANAVLADETLSEDDQAKVDEAVNELNAAIDGLIAKDGSNGDNGNTGDGNNNGAGNSNETGQSDESGNQSGGANAGSQNQERAAKTGDSGSLVFPIVGAGLGVISFIIAGSVLMKRKRK